MANPSVIDQIKNSLAPGESGGRSDGGYGALGPVLPTGSYAGDRAYGKYQVMGNNIPSWTKEATGTSYTAQDFLKNPQLQEAVVSHRVGQLYNQYGNPKDVASAWFTGGPLKGNENKKDVLGTSDASYVNNFENLFGTPAMASETSPGQLTHDQLTANINAMEKQGAKPQEIQGYLDSLKGTEQPSSDQNQTPSVGGFVQNAFGSAGNLIGGIGNAIMHPVDTISGLASAAGGALESGTNVLGLTDIHNQDTETFGNLVSYFGKRYGGKDIGDIVHNIGHTLYTDPMGAALDLSMFLDAGASVVGKAGKIADIAEATRLAQASDFIQSTSGMLKGGSPEAIKALQTPGTISKLADSMRTIADYTNPITGAAEAAKGIVGLGGKAVGETGAKIVGAPLETLIDYFKNPQDYSKIAREASSRGGLANEFGNAIDQIEQAKSATGAEYKGIRDSKVTVEIPDSTITDAFAKNGLTVTKNASGKWQIAAPTADTTLSAEDVAHYKSFLNQFGGKELNANQLLNARTKLSEFSKYEGKTDASTALARSLRENYDALGKKKIPGLAELDTKMAPQLQEWKAIRKEFLTKDVATNEWVIKPGTANKLANALGKGKEGLAAKLEEILPGITRKIEILKNIENVENAMGIKVGNYTRSALEAGGAASALITGNLALAAGLIISHPAVATEILRKLGYVNKATIIPVLGRVRALLGLLPPGTIATTLKAGVINSSAQSSQPSTK